MMENQSDMENNAEKDEEIILIHNLKKEAGPLMRICLF